MDEDLSRVPRDSISVSADELCEMLRVRRALANPHNGVEYRSLSHVAKLVEQSLNPSSTMKRLLSKMQALGFFVITPMNRLSFDDERFDSWAEAHAVGRLWLEFYDKDFGGKYQIVEWR